MKNVPGQVGIVVRVVLVALPIARSPDQRQQRCHDVKIAPCQMVQNLMKGCQWIPNGYQWVPREKEQDQRLTSAHTKKTFVFTFGVFIVGDCFFPKRRGCQQPFGLVIHPIPLRFWWCCCVVVAVFLAVFLSTTVRHHPKFDQDHSSLLSQDTGVTVSRHRHSHYHFPATETKVKGIHHNEQKGISKDF